MLNRRCYYFESNAVSFVYKFFKINDTLNNVKNNADKIKLAKKLDVTEKAELKPNGIACK